MPETKKGRVASKVYIYADDTEGRRVKHDAVALEFRFVGGTVERIDFDKVVGDAAACAMRFGISERTGNIYAGALGKEMTEADCADAVAALRELYEVGTWAVEGEKAGPRISLIFEAVCAAKVAAGFEVDEAAIRARIKDRGVKATLAYPEVAVEYARIQLARQQAKLAKSEKAAADATDTEVGDL